MRGIKDESAVGLQRGEKKGKEERRVETHLAVHETSRCSHVYGVEGDARKVVEDHRRIRFGEDAEVGDARRRRDSDGEVEDEGVVPVTRETGGPESRLIGGIR